MKDIHVHACRAGERGTQSHLLCANSISQPGGFGIALTLMRVSGTRAALIRAGTPTLCLKYRDIALGFM